MYNKTNNFKELTKKIVSGLCIYFAIEPWTLKISPDNPGLSIYFKIDHFSLFRDENTLLWGFGGLSNLVFLHFKSDIISVMY